MPSRTPQKHDDVAGRGNGFVDVFDTDGHLLRRFASRGPLNSPWGVARASFAFGRFSGDILVGNFGDGRINAFDSSGRFIDELDDTNGKPLVIDGLWTLTLGGGRTSSSDTLYFTAGPNGETERSFRNDHPYNGWQIGGPRRSLSTNRGFSIVPAWDLPSEQMTTEQIISLILATSNRLQCRVVVQFSNCTTTQLLRDLNPTYEKHFSGNCESVGCQFPNMQLSGLGPIHNLLPPCVIKAAISSTRLYVMPVRCSEASG